MMSWRDRDYSRGNTSMGSFPDSPWALLNWSLPVGRIFGVRLRLHFWLLLWFVLDLLFAVRSGLWLDAGWMIVASLAALLLHEWGHHVAAQLVGGRHDDFLLWPFGNMIPPTHPPEPWPTFIAQVGGMAANLAAAAPALLWLYWQWRVLPLLLFNPLLALSATVSPPAGLGMVGNLIYWFYWANLTLFLVNLLPYYWFDGAYLLQALLWPGFGAYRAIDITCIVGMVLAVPGALLDLYAGQLLMLLMWVLLFYSSFQRRRQLQAQGPEVLEQFLSIDTSLRDLPISKRRKLARRRLRWTSRHERQERKDQQRLDQILAKVHEQGLHRLSWREKRFLRRATARQRERDLVARR